MTPDKRLASRWLWTALLVVTVAIPVGAAVSQSAQEGAESSEKPSEQAKPVNPDLPRIAIEGQSASPGTNVVVPLYLTPPRGVELRSVSVDIEWVSKNLKFLRLERGISAETIGADVSGKVTGTSEDAKSIEHSTLRVEASVSDKEAKQGIPDGLLAYLTFRVSADAKPFAIELRPKLVSAESTGTGKRFTQAEVQSGKIAVELPGLPPYVTCFFFSH